MSDRSPGAQRPRWSILLCLTLSAVAVGQGVIDWLYEQHLISTRWFVAAVLMWLATCPESPQRDTPVHSRVSGGLKYDDDDS